MPKSIKKKECGIMKGGTGGGTAGGAAVLTAVDVAAASARTSTSYSTLVGKIQGGDAITSKELYDYIS